MSHQPRTDLQASAEQAERDRLIEALERRIGELEALGDSEVGRFTKLDWFFCIAGSIVIPAAALWWFAR